MSEYGFKMRDFNGKIVTVYGPKELYEPLVDAGVAARALPPADGRTSEDLIYGGYIRDPGDQDQAGQEKCYGALIKMQRKNYPI